MSQVIDWLLESNHPSVRFKTRVNVLGYDVEVLGVLKAAGRIEVK
jgi:hypothetical protein